MLSPKPASDVDEDVAIQSVCAHLLQTIAAWSPRITDAIRDELPELTVVELEEHRASVAGQQRWVLEALARRRGPIAQDLQSVARLGRRRAEQGVSLRAVISAFHVGNRLLWGRLCEAATDQGEERVLAMLGALMWHCVEKATGMLAVAHSEALQQAQVRRAADGRRLLELLQQGQLGPDADDLCRSLGLDPHDRFVACVVPESVSASRIEAALGRSVRGVWAATDEITTMLLQAESSSCVAELLSTLDVSGAGIGYARAGLQGAHTSLRDARRAASGLLADGHIACFENHWLWAILIEAMPDVAPLIEQVKAAARDHPMLAESALTFGDQHFSAAAAARISGTHPNTILYRLSRWQQESGCDPRTVLGHVTTRLAAWLVRTDTLTPT